MHSALLAPTQPTPSFERTAADWIRGDKSPWSALVGASFLLGAREQPAALEKLKRLTASDAPGVVWLAQAQLCAPRWRPKATRDSSSICSRSIIARRHCGSGPYFLVGMALLKKRPEEASLALMHLPILYPRERQLAAAALLSVGELFEQRRQTAAAARIYRELVDQYSGSPEAGVALMKLGPSGSRP